MCSSLRLAVTIEGCSVLFRRSKAQDVRSELSRLLNSQVGRQAARGWLELAGTIGATRGAAGLKGSLRARTCQAAIRTLRATAALAALPCPCRRRTSTWGRCRGFGGRQACWAASTAAHRSSGEPAFESRPRRDDSPDWWIRGTRP